LNSLRDIVDDWLKSSGPAKPEAAAFPDNPFWDFSLTVYAREGVAEACLALQDRHGLDVNLVLFCLWAGTGGQRLAAADLDGLAAAVDDWQRQVVRPLRALRGRLKSQDAVERALSEPLRQEIKRQELQAERIEQLLLFRALPGAVTVEGGSSALAADNLAAYLALRAVAPDAADRRALGRLLAGAIAGPLPAEGDAPDAD
jgi:uncharacterized protein (TIGR02444 family)